MMEHINEIAGLDRQFHPICLDNLGLVSLCIHVISQEGFIHLVFFFGGPKKIAAIFIATI